MNRLTMHLAIAAAALTAVAGSASAQIMKAEIPFSFHAGNTLMQPGSYDVQVLRSAGNTQFLIRNNDTHKGAFVLGMLEPGAPKGLSDDAPARLSFECAEGQCVLRQLWPGAFNSYSLSGPKVGSDGPTHTTEIMLMKANAN
jgi:hypothetical protein